MDLTTIIMDPGSRDFKRASWSSQYFGDELKADQLIIRLDPLNNNYVESQAAGIFVKAC